MERWGSYLCASTWSRGGISVLLLFTSFLTWDWKDLVGLVFEIWKLFPRMKSSILDSYSAVGMITSELPLSARAIMASLSSSFVFMFLRVVDSEHVLCVCVCVRAYCSFVGH
jgi:hypothetical protein